MAILLKGSATKKLEAITCSQENINAELTRLYNTHRERLEAIKGPGDVREWARELGREDVDWFYGELLTMCCPSYVTGLSPELYNRLTRLHSAFIPKDSWFGNHLKLGYKEKPE